MSDTAGAKNVQKNEDAEAREVAVALSTEVLGLIMPAGVDEQSNRRGNVKYAASVLLLKVSGIQRLAAVLVRERAELPALIQIN